MTHALDDITPLTWRDARREDLPAVAELLDAIEYIDGLAAPIDPTEVGELLLHAEQRDDCILLLGSDAGTPVAIAWLVGHDLTRTDGEAPRWRARLVSELHPAYRHQQIGQHTMDWLIRSARELFVEHHVGDHAVMDLQMFIDDRWQRRVTGLSERGLREQRWFFDLHCDFDELDHQSEAAGGDQRWTPPLPPEGVELFPFNAAIAGQVRSTHNAAFATRRLSRPISQVEWFESLSRVDARPEWSWVAVADGEVVGYALNSVVEWSGEQSEGWTDRLGTLPNWRGRGIAASLLGASLASFRAAGLGGGGLGVDSEVGSEGLGLYRSIGYQSSETIVQFGRSETVADAMQLL